MAKCDMCGGAALEVISICPECLKKAAVDPKQIKRLKQISNILSITAGTDTNIKECMESLIEIAEDLERSGNNGKEKTEKESYTIQTGKKDNIQHGEAEQAGKEIRDKTDRDTEAGET